MSEEYDHDHEEELASSSESVIPSPSLATRSSRRGLRGRIHAPRPCPSGSLYPQDIPKMNVRDASSRTGQA